jgi:hypothetical protein
MKTQSSLYPTVLNRFKRLNKTVLLAAVAAVFALPQVEARPGGGEKKSSRHHGPVSKHYHPAPRYQRPPHRPAPPPVRRAWARPGFHGHYPPAGFVDYHYIHSLPRGYRTVYRNGHRYYFANGKHYWPARYNDRSVYITVHF